MHERHTPRTRLKSALRSIVRASVSRPRGLPLVGVGLSAALALRPPPVPRSSPALLLLLAALVAIAALRWRRDARVEAAPAAASFGPAQLALAVHGPPRSSAPAGDDALQADERSELVPMLTFTWAPCSAAQWDSARAPATASVDARLAARQLARPVPPGSVSLAREEFEATADVERIHPNVALRRPYGGVDWLASDVLRVIDGVPHTSGWTQIELRLRPRAHGDGGALEADVAVFLVPAPGAALEALRVSACEVTLDRLPAARGAGAPAPVVARYALDALDPRGRAHALAGLVEIGVP
jgi:hypothetical protein